MAIDKGSDLQKNIYKCILDEQVKLLHPRYQYKMQFLLVFYCFVFYLDEKCKCIMINVCCWMGDLALQQQNQCWDFLDTVNVINIILCKFVVFIELYPLMPFFMTVATFQILSLCRLSIQ